MKLSLHFVRAVDLFENHEPLSVNLHLKSLDTINEQEGGQINGCVKDSGSMSSRVVVWRSMGIALAYLKRSLQHLNLPPRKKKECDSLIITVV